MRTPIRSASPLLRLAGAVLATAVIASACSSTTDLGATDSTASTPKANDTAKVTYIGLTWDNSATPCTAPFVITWQVTVDSAKIGDVLVAHVTGPGSPGPLHTTLTADSQNVVTKFTAPAGPGSWTGTVDSVGGKKPRSFLLSATSTVSCS